MSAQLRALSRTLPIMENADELERKDSENGEEEGRKQLGGVRTMPFILANEICDRFAGAGFHINLITYLTQVMNLPLVEASNTLTNFGGTANFTPLFGAFIADSFAGRFWTITVASFIYLLGMVTITISAVLPQLRPPPCPSQVNCQQASSQQLWVLYIALLLSAIGTGGLRPCVVMFAADQFDMKKLKTATKWNFFNWYFICMAFASLLAITVVVYIQENISWGWGLGIPTIAMAVSILAFVIGSPLYKKIKPGGSPFVRVVQVVVAAWRKRRAVRPADPAELYDNRELDAGISLDGRLMHSNQFKWLDRAAVKTDTDMNAEQKKPNLWRLATVHRVEELKTVVRVLPIWAASILLVASSSHLHSFTVQQARIMDRHLSRSFQIPPASMSIFSTMTVILGLPLYERLFVPLARTVTKNPAGVTCLQRMGIGFAINIVATATSALIESKRKHYHQIVPISVFWLLPQYVLHGLAEVFMNVGHLEFLYDQSPESMRSTAAALFWIAIAMGNYVGTIIVTLVHKYTGRTGNWLPDRNLNRGYLDYYYWLATGVQVVNLVYYLICVRFYKLKPLEEMKESRGGDEELQLVTS